MTRHYTIRIFVLIFLLKVSQSQLRFCYKGPHIIKYADCPGGFIANKPLHFECVDYRRDANVLAAMISDSVCTEQMEIASDPGSVAQISKLQYFFVNKTADTPGDEPYTGEPPCQEQSCLDNWEDLNPAEPEFDDQIPPPTENMTKFQQEQNQKVFTELIDEDDANPSPDPLAANYDANGFIRLYKLLAKSMRIMIQGCDGFIENAFFSQVLRAMMILLDKSNHTQVDIGIDEFKRVDAALDKCSSSKMGDNKGFMLVGTKCNNLNNVCDIIPCAVFIVEGTNYTGRGYVPYTVKAKSFRWYTASDTKKGPKYDPIVEAAWDAVDFVHGFCFSSFVSNYNYHHIYTTAMEALFPKFPIQQRWLYPALVKNDGQFWNNVLQTADIKMTMKNLDACAIAAYVNTPFINRLDKPFYNMPDPNAPPPAPVDPEKGWKGTIEDYWTMYNKRGGFPAFASTVGTCIKTENFSKRDQLLQTLSTKCTDNSNGDPAPAAP